MRSLTRQHDGRWAAEIGEEDGLTIQSQDVVIATGGFEWDLHLRSTLLPYDVQPISAPSNEGDGLYIAMNNGADIAETGATWGVPVICPPDMEYDGIPSGRMGNVEMTLPGSITVNRRGRRFVNEALNYHDLNRVFGNVEPGTPTPANAPAWLVMDSNYVDRYPVAGSTPGKPPEWLERAETIGELASRIGIDPVGLEETVARFNQHARRREDPDFGRGQSEEDRHLGDPTAGVNPCLAPLERGPFYAVQVHPGVLGTAGGIRVNDSGHVLNRESEPIPGLWSAGNCSATVFHGAYPGGGATLRSAMVRGFAMGETLGSQ